MRMKTSLFKRSLAALLSFVLVLGMIPAFGMAPVAYAEEETGGEGEGTETEKPVNAPDGNYITLPITVRDFAADGMLFEYNEMGEITFSSADTPTAAGKYDASDLTILWDTPTSFTITDRYNDANSTASDFDYYTMYYNPASSDTNFTGSMPTGIFVLSEDYSWDYENHTYWYCLIIDASGRILKVMPSGTDKTGFADAMDDNYTLADGSTVQPAYSVWTWRGPKNLASYSLLAKVTEGNKDQYQIGFTSTTAGGNGNFYLGIPCRSSITVDAQNKYNGIYAVNGSVLSGQTGAYIHWKIIICDSETNGGQVRKIVEPGETDYASYTTDNYKFVMVQEYYPEHLATIAHITEANMGEYQLVAPTCAAGGALFIEHTITANASNTKGFGLLYTEASKDYRNWLDATNDAKNLPNTQYLEYYENYTGSADYFYTDIPHKAYLWEVTPEGTVVNYATQDLYGAGIRTNLVGKTLDGEGKPVYTRTTVDFLANYMAMVMPVDETDPTNKYFNTNHVMGVEMFDASGNYVDINGANADAADTDLAQVLRDKVWAPNGYSNTEGWKLGDYDTSENKFIDGGLRTYKDVETWYDAAYFLLHNTWRDSADDATRAGSDGYGKPSNYQNMYLVQTTNANGDICYVFNAKYDGTIYNHDAGVIYNTPFGEKENAENRTYSFAYDYDGEVEKAYGVELPDKRFDPLGPSGAKENLGYGMSGATYGDYGNLVRKEYYDETNYNLTLEGHAEFVYNEGANLYFTFTGDDDVYLYINGVRVLDIGGAHSISQVSINVNDVAEACKLKNGGTYRFDFFYMERHGTAANFGIETNIQLAEPGMTTTKQGYQSGVSTGYDGPVNPDQEVSYSFTLTNTGKANLTDLTFDDELIGVTLTKDKEEIVLNEYTKIENMHLYIRNSDGSYAASYGPQAGTLLTTDILTTALATGLTPGQSMTIFNLRYKIKDEQWTQLKDDKYESFTNTVVTTAMSGSKELHGNASWKVHKSPLTGAEPFHIYNFVKKGAKDTNWNPQNVELTKAELLQPILDANSSYDLDEADIVLCNSSGSENKKLWSDEYNNIIENVTLNADDSLVYNSKAPGMETVYYKVKNIVDSEHVFHFDVITYGIGDNIYVLDYGLAVELNGDDFGFRANDHLVVPGNVHNPNTTIKIRTNTDTERYGDLVYETVAAQADGTTPERILKDINSSVKYVPDEFIDGVSTFEVDITILESNKTLSKFTGVHMVENVDIAPANVVYYEENFPGITYVEEGANDWVHYETVVEKTGENGDLVLDEDGNPIYESVAGTEQSADPNMNYGSDPNYEKDKTGTLDQQGSVGTVETIKSDGAVQSTTTLDLDTSDLNAVQKLGIAALNAYFGLEGGEGGVDSNGTVNKLEVKQTATVMYFDFMGTGFELISRTTMEEYAIINVQVQKKNEDGTYTVVRQKPVICESKGGDQYQIPVISITDLDKDMYRVVIQAGTTGNVNRVFYVDGIRIYGPLVNDKALEYYNPEEYKAEFYEVKQLIQSGHFIYSDVSDSDDELRFVTGTTLVENTNPDTDSVLTPISGDVNEYLSVGPNNELYLDGMNTNAVIAFFLTPMDKDENGNPYPENARTFEIGVHRKADSFEEEMGAVRMVYGSTVDDIIEGTYCYDIGSGTEMYYTINTDNLVKDEKTGRYLVMIGTNGSDDNIVTATLALTSIKVAGYEIDRVESAIQLAAEDNTLDTLSIVQQTFAVLRKRLEIANQVPEVEQIPVNENLVINSAAVKAAEVVSGKNNTLTVKAGSDAQTIVVTDAEGNVVEALKLTRKVSGDVASFNFTWTLTGSRGDVLNYTIRVYDANGLASINTETVTVTIK